MGLTAIEENAGLGAADAVHVLGKAGPHGDSSTPEGAAALHRTEDTTGSGPSHVDEIARLAEHLHALATNEKVQQETHNATVSKVFWPGSLAEKLKGTGLDEASVRKMHLAHQETLLGKKAGAEPKKSFIDKLGGPAATAILGTGGVVLMTVVPTYVSYMQTKQQTKTADNQFRASMLAQGFKTDKAGNIVGHVDPTTIGSSAGNAPGGPPMLALQASAAPAA